MFLDTSEFDATDGKYAMGVIRDALLRRNAMLVDKRAKADIVVELRSGALATNDHQLLVGIPSFKVGLLSTPKIAFYDDTTQLGVAKFSASVFSAKTDALVSSSPPQYGFAHKNDYIVLLFFEGHHDDLIPK